MTYLVSPNETIIVEPEDWKYDEWCTICKLFGADPEKAERITIQKGTVLLTNK